MSRDLFGDVAHPRPGLGSRQWYTLPLSVLAHTAVLAAAVVVPLMATGILPVPSQGLSVIMTAEPVLPREIPVAPASRQAPSKPLPVTQPDVAPIDAPVGVRPETGLVQPERPNAGVDGGLPVAIQGGGLVADPPPPPAPAVAPPTPVHVSSGVKPPTKVHDVTPEYPLLARQAKVEGLVIIEATLGSDGRVTQARVLRSVPLLDQAALDAVRQWIFTPTLLNGVPTPVIMTVTVRFTLQ